MINRNIILNSNTKNMAFASTNRITKTTVISLLFLLFTGISAHEARAQQTSETEAQISRDDIQPGDDLSVSLDEAIQIAMVHNYMLRGGYLDIENADAQIREAWSAVYPQLSGSGSYTRNIETPNPFAGSDAGGLFESFGAIDWISFNEERRTDGNPDTEPISFEEFTERQAEGYREAGLSPPGSGSDNPFAIENEFQFGLNLTQTIYNGAAFAAIKGAQQLRDVNSDQLKRDRQIVTERVTQAFYGSLLASEQLEVLQASVDRLEETVEETRKAVDAGLRSRQDRLSAEVELVNLETDLISLENEVENSLRNLALLLGIPTQAELSLRGQLEFDESDMPDLPQVDEAYTMALQQRSDVSQADDFLELLDVERNITRAQYRPRLNAFANLAYSGRVPDNREVISRVPGEEFQFQSSTNGFFDDNYWNPAFSVGLQLSWNIFDGFQTRSQVAQNRIEYRRAQLNREQLRNSIYAELNEAIGNLENAYRRIQSQQRNIEQAELNYDIAAMRLSEGLGTALEERQASSLLDQSRLNYLSAIFDYKVALSAYETAMGQALPNP